MKNVLHLWRFDDRSEKRLRNSRFVLTAILGWFYASGSGLAAEYRGAEQAQVVHGRKLFTRETFDGNGRTCMTCHGTTTGTLSPAEAQKRFLRASGASQGSQGDSLFRSIDSDDGVGSQFDRLLTNATIRAAVDLPANVSLEAEPAARSVVLNRGIPSVINSELARVLMADGREPNLQSQAFHAIMGHAEASTPPTEAQLGQIAEFERSLFSRPELERYSSGGPTPTLPEGRTSEEIRGRKHFEAGGLCAICHSGPMLDTTLDGRHFENIFVSERNLLSNPTRTFVFKTPDGSTNRVSTPDPGRALITGDATDVNFFRIPSLWNVKNTAPYFHDNSAKTFEEMMAHYQLYLPLSDQDTVDIIAFLKLL